MTQIRHIYPAVTRWRIMEDIRLAIARRISNWRARSRLRQMEQLDDRMLDDIGLTRADLQWAARLPTSKNPIAELACRTRSRH